MRTRRETVYYVRADVLESPHLHVQSGTITGYGPPLLQEVADWNFPECTR